MIGIEAKNETPRNGRGFGWDGGGQEIAENGLGEAEQAWK
jgi:hypothetical protein